MSSNAPVAFRRYDEEFKSLTQQIASNLQADDGNFHDEETGGEDSSNLLSQCDELLQQMALEARSVVEQSTKRELLAQVRSYKTELQKLKDDYNKQSLMSSRAGTSGGSGQHRERLLQQQQMLENQNSQLDNARRVIQETEQVALEITEELGV